MLLREDRRRTEHECLPIVERDRERRPHGDLGLAEADVAAHQPIHRPPGLEVLLDGLDRLQLVVRLAIRKRALEALEPVARQIEGLPNRLAALRVEREELPRELPDGRARAALEVLPRLATELRERRGLRVRADVARDLRDLLVRDVEPILAFEGEEEVVTGDSGDVLRLEAEQAPDPVILVHDVVADTEVGERLESTAEPRVDPRGALAEDLRVRKQRDPEVSPHEAATSRADDECERRLGRQGVDVVPNDRLDPSQESLSP